MVAVTLLVVMVHVIFLRLFDDRQRKGKQILENTEQSVSRIWINEAR